MKNIAILSDPQIDIKKGQGQNELGLLQTCFSNIKVDAVAVCGDITENASADEWNAFLNTYKRYCPAAELFLIPGNKDKPETPEGKAAYYDAYGRFLGIAPDNVYFTRETEDCILFGISPEEDNDKPLSDAQVAALDTAVQKATERKVPALVFSHYVLDGTINVNWNCAFLGSQSEVLKCIFEKYGGKVICFSGHIHRGLIQKPGGSFCMIHNVAYVSTPSICKPDQEHYHADNDRPGTGYMLEIRPNSVRIRGYDFLHNTFLPDFDWTI